jgi:hypothetical protein
MAAALAVPTASAALVPRHEFSTAIGTASFGGDVAAGPDGLLANTSFFTGAMTWTSEGRGVYGVTGATAFSAIQVTRVEVFNQTAVDQMQKRRGVPRGPFMQTFTESSLTANPDADVALVAQDVGLRYECEAPFAVTLPVRLPRDMFEGSEDVVDRAHLMASGPDQSCSLEQSANTVDTVVLLLDNASAVTVTPADGEPATFQGEQWAFKLFGTPRYTMAGDGILTPFSVAGRATVTTYGGVDVADRFTVEPLTRMAKLMQEDEGGGPGNETEDGSDPLADSIGQLATVLDGALLGNLAQSMIVDGEHFKDGGWSLVRYERMDMQTDANGTMAMSGQSRLILVDGEVYTVRDYAALGPLQIPSLSVLLWIVAGAALLGSLVLKPFVGADQVKTFGLMRLLGLIFHILAMVAAFVLFDLEVKAVIGTSLLTLVFTGTLGQAGALGAVAFFQLLPFALAALFFGLPMRFLTNAALRLGGLRGAGGFGKGVGNLAIWGIGAIYLRVLIGGFLALAMEMAAGGLGGA